MGSLGKGPGHDRQSVGMSMPAPQPHIFDSSSQKNPLHCSGTAAISKGSAAVLYTTSSLVPDSTTVGCQRQWPTKSSLLPLNSGTMEVSEQLGYGSVASSDQVTKPASEVPDITITFVSCPETGVNVVFKECNVQNGFFETQPNLNTTSRSSTVSPCEVSSSVVEASD